MTYISAFITFFISLATMIIALRQYYISKQQKDIALYEHRYHKIYKLFFDTIQKQQDILIRPYITNIENLDEINGHFAEQMNFSKFLIKESDFKSIMDIYTKITKLFADFVSNNQSSKPQEYLENYKIFNQQLTACKSEFIDIINPYLQIEKEAFVVRIWQKIRKTRHD